MTTAHQRPVTATGPDADAPGGTAVRDGAGAAGVDRGLILDGGWAGDLLVAGGKTWVAWATCDDPEPPLLAPVNWQTPLKRTAPLRPGVTAEDWRRLAGRVGFALSLARLDGDGDTRSVADARRLTRSAHALEGPALAALPGAAEPAVLWAERRGAGHVLLAWIGGRVEVVHEARGAMIGPRATSTAGAPGAGGDVSAVWQQWPAGASAGGPRIVFARRTAGGWSTPRAVSAEGQSSWAPALTTGPDGTVWCAWDGWDGGAYQVYVSYLARAGAGSPARAWAAPVRVSGPSRSGYGGFYHLAPDVAADEGGAWIVWNRSARWGEVNHRFNHHRSLHAARVTLPGGGGGAVSVEPVAGRPVLGEIGRLPVVSQPFQHTPEEEYVNPQAARIRLDRTGRPVVFYREFRSAEMKDFGWTVCAVAHTGDDWTAPQIAGSATGAPEAPYGVAPAPGGPGRWLLAYHAADYAVTVDFQPSKPLRRHRLVVETARVAASAPSGHDAMRYALPFDGPRRRPAAPAALAGRARPAALEQTFGGTTYALLYGDLHRHSIYSKCMSANDGDPLDHWRWVQDVAALDFYALTEHLEYLSFLEWRRVEDLAESLAAGGVLALPGFELAIPPGHTNFFYADQRVGYDLRVACLTSATLADVWPKLDAWIPAGKVVAVRHHQGHRGDDLASGYAARYEPLAEVLQSRGEYPEWVAALRRQGFKVGVAGATDHSRAAPIVHGLTGLWLPAGERTREGVLAGLRARRTFATNGARMAVFLSAEPVAGAAGAAGTPDATGAGPAAIGMGQSGGIAGPPRLVAQVVGSRRVESVAFYRDERLLHVAVVDADAATVGYEDRDAPPGEHAYWVRVVQVRESANGRPINGVAYSSPVWVTLGA